MKRTINYVIFGIIVVIACFLSKESINCLLTVVSNYESLSITSLGGFPLYFLTLSIYIVCFLIIRLITNDKLLSYRLLRYSLGVMILSFLGIVSSILAGTIIYDGFFHSYLFKNYPLISLIAHSLLFVSFTLLYFKTRTALVNTNELKNGPKITMKGFWKGFAFVDIMLLSFSFFGMFLDLPSILSENSYLALPFYLQLAIPFLTFYFFVFHKFFVKDNKKKLFSIVASCSILGFSFVSFIITAITYTNNPIEVTALTSSLLQIDHLISFPLCFLLIYLFSIAFPLANVIVILVKRIKKKNDLQSNNY